MKSTPKNSEKNIHYTSFYAYQHIQKLRWRYFLNARKKISMFHRKRNFSFSTLKISEMEYTECFIYLATQKNKIAEDKTFINQFEQKSYECCWKWPPPSFRQILTRLRRFWLTCFNILGVIAFISSVMRAFRWSIDWIQVWKTLFVKCPHRKKSGGERSGLRGGQGNVAPLEISRSWKNEDNCQMGGPDSGFHRTL